MLNTTIVSLGPSLRSNFTVKAFQVALALSLLLKLLQKMISRLALQKLMINKRLAVEQRRAVQAV